MKLYRTPVLSFSAAHGCCVYTHIYTHTVHTYTYTYIHIHTYICMCVVYIRLAGTRRLSRHAGGSALRAVTASAGNAQEKYGGDQMVEPCSEYRLRHRQPCSQDAL
jgi:hypothetical protein